MSDEKTPKVVYKFSRLFVLLIVVLVIAVCLQSIYIFNLSREINGQPGIIPLFCNTQLTQKPNQPPTPSAVKTAKPITPVYAVQQQAPAQPQYNVIQTSPRSNANRFQNRINQMLNDQFFTQQPLSRNHVNVMQKPSLTMMQKPDKYILKFVLPGMAKKDISITLRNNVLTVSGKNQQKTAQNNNNFIESSFNQFTQSIAVPSDVNSSEITSNYNNGILSIVLPKTSDQKTNQNVNIN
ncbi:MAG: Hsp20/alpha crystallin family protein [bacterium]|nr:Hsp20/alpha crystallin family protein [bacterium]